MHNCGRLLGALILHEPGPRYWGAREPFRRNEVGALSVSATSQHKRPRQARSFKGRYPGSQGTIGSAKDWRKATQWRNVNTMEERWMRHVRCHKHRHDGIVVAYLPLSFTNTWHGSRSGGKQEDSPTDTVVFIRTNCGRNHERHKQRRHWISGRSGKAHPHSASLESLMTGARSPSCSNACQC